MAAGSWVLLGRPAAELADYVIGTGPRTVQSPAQDVHVAYSEIPQKEHAQDLRESAHGMCTTHADVINADLLAFIKRSTGRLCGKEGDTQ